MSLSKAIWICIIAIVLGACHGGGDDVEVKQFDINGSSPDLEDGRVTIDSSINDGEFELVWKVDDDGAKSYTARFYLSRNDNLSLSKDIRFASIFCGESTSCDDDDLNDETCYFTNDLEMYCGDKDDSFRYDVDDLIDSLPEDLFIIIDACNDFDCDTQAVPIRLR